MAASLVMSAQEFADTFGISKHLVYRLLDEGVLPEVLPGVSRRRLIPRRAADQVLEHAMAGFDPARAAQQMRAAS